MFVTDTNFIFGLWIKLFFYQCGWLLEWLLLSLYGSHPICVVSGMDRCSFASKSSSVKQRRSFSFSAKFSYTSVDLTSREDRISSCFCIISTFHLILPFVSWRSWCWYRTSSSFGSFTEFFLGWFNSPLCSTKLMQMGLCFSFWIFRRCGCHLSALFATPLFWIHIPRFPKSWLSFNRSSISSSSLFSTIRGSRFKESISDLDDLCFRFTNSARLDS